MPTRTAQQLFSERHGMEARGGTFLWTPRQVMHVFAPSSSSSSRLGLGSSLGVEKGLPCHARRWSLVYAMRHSQSHSIYTSLVVNSSCRPQEPECKIWPRINQRNKMKTSNDSQLCGINSGDSSASIISWLETPKLLDAGADNLRTSTLCIAAYIRSNPTSHQSNLQLIFPVLNSSSFLLRR
ncbi:hypothetical protein LMH87_006763 [Akanthomyces muscarius]|uniref:Uncharacterized protein n=1 Tax=Akanthomyces muscarius TaxID=2231603 RepID=A0A9W8URS9_AKAMU|nr:hypothetical protein LMH87_006763 [Akanthomyces muscarius]KAJ4165116.1 hypothetical protein LMH87_006763 [Akanthomyces muscarius]